MAGEDQQLYHPEETIFRIRTAQSEQDTATVPLTEDAMKYRRDEAMQSDHAYMLRELQKRHSFIPGKQAETDRFSVTFKPEISESKRSVKKHLAGTAIHAKRKNAETLSDVEKDVAKQHEKLLEQARKYAVKDGSLEAGPGPQLLKDLSCFFMEGRKYAGANKKLITDATDPDSAKATLDMCRERFMELSLENLDFRTDETFVRESGRLEEITYKYQAIKRLMASNPDYWNNLPDERRDMLAAKLEMTGRFVAYYRAKKALLKNDYYSSHYNSEMSRFVIDSTNEDELNVTDLINNVGMAEYFLRHRPSPEATQQYMASRARSMIENDWRRMINTHKRINYSDPTESSMGDLAAGPMQFVSWALRDKRTTDHGESRYDASVQKLRLLPEQTQRIGEGNVSWQRGNAPAISLDKYFTDAHKTELKALLNQAPQATQDDEYKHACEALENYLKIKGIVNRDTTEMEMAFLDRFLKAHQRYLSGHPNDASQDFTERKTFLDNVASKINTLGGGHLGEDMPDGMLDFIKEHAEVISEDTTFTHNEESSNIKDIPLFLHTPNINDIKQSSIGDCWLVSALTTLAATDPEYITSMMKDLGDGSVLIRLYSLEDSKGNQVFDHKQLESKEISLQPAYYRIRKDYETGEGNAGDCTWVQLVEKAYALAGFNVKHQAKVKDGKMSNVAEELTCGSAQLALSHITGRIIKNAEGVTDVSPSYIVKGENATTFFEMTAGLPTYIQETMKSELARYGNGIHSGTMLACVESAYIQMSSYFKGKADQIAELINERVGMTAEQKTQCIDLVKKVVSYDATLEDYQSRLSANLESLSNGESLTHSPFEIPEYKFEELANSLNMVVSRLATEGEVTDAGVKDHVYGILHVYAVTVETPDSPTVVDMLKVRYGSGLDDAEYAAKKAAAEETAKVVAYGYKYENDGRYNLGQMKFLSACRDATLNRKGAVSLSIPHYVSVVDTQQQNGTWYLLVKDPFNTYNKVYGDPETPDGPETCEEEAFKDVLIPSKNTVKRELSDDAETSLLGGFRGLSWWKLEDLYAVTEQTTPLTVQQTRRS